MEISELRKRIITVANQDFLQLGLLPSMADYVYRLKSFNVTEEDVIKALAGLDDAFKSRFGLSIFDVYFEKPKKEDKEFDLFPDDKKKSSLTKFQLDLENEDYPPNFILACNIILQTTDKRSTSAKLKAVGVSTAEWEAYLKIPVLFNFFEEALNKTFGKAETSAKLSLMRNIEAGDLPSIKHFQEYTGRFRPNTELTMNLGLIIAKLMEILAAKLSPEDLAEVADSVDQLLTSPKELQVG